MEHAIGLEMLQSTQSRNTLFTLIAVFNRRSRRSELLRLQDYHCDGAFSEFRTFNPLTANTQYGEVRVSERFLRDYAGYPTHIHHPPTVSINPKGHTTLATFYLFETKETLLLPV